VNHLHEWLEWEEKNNDPLPSEPMHSWIKSSICFAMPAMSVIPRMEQRKELMRLPYQNCWIEGNGKITSSSTMDDGIVAMYCRQKTDGFVAIISRRATADGSKNWSLYGGLGWSNHEGWVYQPELRSSINLATAYTDWLGNFLTLLNCSNVSRQEHHPSGQLQKARTRRGKLPLFSYWTLNLDVTSSERTDDCGGTHASPRLHLRRGHTRQHRPGKWCWINPHAVGNKRLGIVHKDYAMRPLEGTA